MTRSAASRELAARAKVPAAVVAVQRAATVSTDVLSQHSFVASEVPVPFTSVSLGLIGER